MTVIRPNSISGITSITAQANEINVFKSDGTLAGLSLNGVNVNTTTGISTYAALNVTGNISIGGTLTYQDVTNVDSLGIGTFRAGIDVSGGHLDLNDNVKIRLGTGTDLSVYHNGTNSYVRNTTGQLLVGGSGGNLVLEALGDVRTMTWEGESMIEAKRNGAVELYHNNSKTAYTHGSGFNIKGGNTSDQTELLIYGNEGQDASILLASDDGDDNADFWRMYAQASDNAFTLKNYAAGSYETSLRAVGNGSVELYDNNVKMAHTFGSGFKISNGGELYIDGNAASGHCQINMTRSDRSWAINNETNFRIYTASGNNGNPASGSLYLEINHVGDLMPGSNASQDLGTSSRRWDNLYINDLQLSNKGKSNDVDGTWGDWTLQEGESDVYMINNRSGKKFKIKMEEVL